jgi:hypothetical protein
VSLFGGIDSAAEWRFANLIATAVEIHRFLPQVCCA